MAFDTDSIDAKCTATELYALTPLKSIALLEVYNKLHPDNLVNSPVSHICSMSEPCGVCKYRIDMEHEYFCIKTREK